jgi:hypothetical protein
MERHNTLWGIHAQLVQAVVTDREWEGAAPLYMAEVLGFTIGPSDTAHPVLLVGAAERTAPIRALGSVLLCQVEVSSVLPVPPLARQPRNHQTVTGIAFVKGGTPLLVLDPIALLALAEEHANP